MLASTLPVGAEASDLASADFNGDGWLDLAVASAFLDGGTTSIMITIFLNDEGHLRRADQFVLGLGFPGALVAGDLNGDGTPDLATGGEFDPLIVMLGKGDGTFHPATTYPNGSVVSGGIKAGYFGHARSPSLVSGSNTGLSIFTGIGDGGFLPSMTIGSYGEGAVAVEDFNQDGFSDIAEANFNSGSGITVVLGASDGGFTLSSTYPLPADSYWSFLWDVASGDLNGDGIWDLAVAGAIENFNAGGGVGILYGKGDGTFGPWSVFQAQGNAYGLAVADLDGDGKNEVLVTATNYQAGAYYSLYQVASGRMDPMLSPDGGLKWVHVGDFNQDGAQDLAVLNGWLNDPFASTSVSIYINGCPPNR